MCVKRGEQTGLDTPFMHQKNMWPATDLWVNAHWKYECVIFAIAPFELFMP